MNLRTYHKLFVCGILAVALLTTRQLSAQYLTLEGQTGGFLTPTAYIVYMEKGQALSHPAIAVHYIDASKVIGNIETFSITEAFYGRAEAGYTRSVHQLEIMPEPPKPCFKFTITGNSNKVVVVEESTDMSVWSRQQTNTIPDHPVEFVDPHWTDYPARFYRLRWP